MTTAHVSARVANPLFLKRTTSGYAISRSAVSIYRRTSGKRWMPCPRPARMSWRGCSADAENTAIRCGSQGLSIPEMDGYEAAREIRRREKPGLHIAIIAMTAEALAGAREQCVSAGMDDYIAKPVMLQDLSRAIEKWLLPGIAGVATPVASGLGSGISYD